MDTRSHVVARRLAARPERVFRALVTPSAIRRWWLASRAIVLPAPGGLWAAAWGESEDEPDYVSAATIELFEPPSRLRLGDYKYFAREGGPPFEAKMTTAFEVRPSGDGSILTVVQDGFPADPVADEFYAACERGWRDTLDLLEGYVGAEA